VLRTEIEYLSALSSRDSVLTCYSQFTRSAGRT